jgi:hypothetical protein
MISLKRVYVGDNEKLIVFFFQVDFFKSYFFLLLLTTRLGRPLWVASPTASASCGFRQLLLWKAALNFFQPHLALCVAQTLWAGGWFG